MAQGAMTAWAVEEFGGARLGDARRDARLVAMAEVAARRPCGRVTQTFECRAAREAAYRFIESDEFSHQAMQAGMQVAAAQRAAAHPFVYIAADSASLRIPNSTGDFGPIAEKAKSTGAQAMTALVVSPDGVPLGVAAQSFWTRSFDRSLPSKHDPRPIADRETQWWLSVLERGTQTFAEHAPATMPWFQMDRGADCASVLLHAAALGVAFTVRACYDRRLADSDVKLWPTLRAAPVLGQYVLAVRAQHGRPARRAVIELRACPVTLRLAVQVQGRGPNDVRLDLWALEAREVGDDVADPILWRLLTNRAIDTEADALAVVRGYTMRWRVEEFHLAWKTGACGIESSRLRDLEHFAKWATILAAVAVRAQRLKDLSRSEPDMPALAEFSRDEIDAVIALRKPKGIAFGASPSISDIVLWIADIGGYTGKSSGGPPGVRVISRALVEVEAAAKAIAAMRRAPR